MSSYVLFFVLIACILYGFVKGGTKNEYRKVC